jgi:1,4-dihydroxy-2-naphthoate polyprenyltransferase
MSKALLEFCGFEMAATISLGPVRMSSEPQRKKWLDRVKARGSSLKYGPLSWKKKLSIRIITWLKALRLQFYPMTAVAYGAGAWSANYFGYTFNATVFWTGYAWLFFLEAATVLINESADYNSDKKNKYFGTFTGGSRVIVEGLLNFQSVRKGIIICLTSATIFLGIVLNIAKGNLKEMLLTALALAILALGYTAKPFKLAYQTMGEITVAITHSFAVIVCGYLFMGGRITDPYPWILGLPLFFSVLPSITLAGIPDYQADLSTGKRTIAVRFGKKEAASAAIIFTFISILILFALTIAGIFPIAFKNLLYFALPHAAWLILKVRGYLKTSDPPKKIDTIMIAALTYLIWYAVIPLINLT